MRISLFLLPLEIHLVADYANYWCKVHNLNFIVGSSLWSPTELYHITELFIHKF